jgi:hypothetical protein
VTPEFAVDWVSALAELSSIPKNKSADMGTHKYKYADLDSALDYVRPILAAHGIVHDQAVTMSDSGAATITTTFTHRSGAEKVVPGATVKPVKGDPQSMGSAISYARRYSLLPALGIATDDDDAVRATKAPTPQRPKPAPRPANVNDDGELNPDAPSAALTKRVMAQCGQLGLDRDERLTVVSAALGREVGSWKDVTRDEASTVTDYLDALIKEPPA